MTDKQPLDMTDLDDLFDAARAQAPVPSQDLMARIMADAGAVAGTVSAPQTAPKPTQNSLWTRLTDAVQAWQAAGLATAAVAGLVIGFATPETLTALTGTSAGVADLTTEFGIDDLMPSFDGLLGEG